MLSLWIYLICMLVIIILAAQLFSNALEHFGQKIGISTGVTGSIFAATATALPEISVPILAMLAGTPDRSVNEDISVGAIVGAPLMLSTLSIFIISLFTFPKRGLHGKLTPEKTGITRDLNFFLIAFLFAIIAMYLPATSHYLRIGITIILIALYATYIVLTCKASTKLVSDGHGITLTEPLILTKCKLKNNNFTILLQLIFGLGLLFMGAKGFINGVHDAATMLGISTLLLSLLIIPIATELPEKINSIFWARQNKDTLSIGNITGAMVLQGTLLPALGIALTAWQPSKEALSAMVLALIAAVWLRLNITRGELRLTLLLVNGGLYLIYLSFVLFR